MSRYRKVDPRIWNDAKFRALDDKSKLVFFFLLTHPHMTAIGAMRASIPGLAAEIGWLAEAFREAFLDVCSKGMAKHDEDACLVWLPNFLRYNPPESPNVVKAWVGSIEMLPECELLTLVITSSKAFAEGLSKAFAEALPEPFAKTMPNQEQEQEQEQEQYTFGAASARPSKVVKPARRATQLSTDFYPDETGVSLADELRVSVAIELQKFSDYHKAKGSTMKDWQAAWRTWARNAAKFSSGRQGVAAGRQGIIDNYAAQAALARGDGNGEDRFGNVIAGTARRVA